MDTTTITLTVTNLNDSGEGSLRQALADAQQSTDQVQIVFDASLAGTISLSSSLTVPANVDVSLPDGVVMNLAGQIITVNGSLNAEYEEVQDAFISTDMYAVITIKTEVS